MTIDEALNRLELEDDYSSDELNLQYSEFYNEFQIRITNAPTDHQRKLYQKKLEELEEAYRVLGGESEDSDADLPSISKVKTESSHKNTKENDDEDNLKRARNVLKVSETSSRKEIIDEYQSHKLELLEIVNSRSGNIVEVAKEELDSIERAIKLLVPDISEKEFNPEIYGKKISKKTSGKLNPKAIVYVFIGLIIFGVGYYLISSGVFESNHNSDLEKAISLMEDSGDWHAAEPLFESLLDSPVGEEAETWLMTISTIKKGEAERFKESFKKYMLNGNLIEAEKYFEQYNEISPLIKDDNELYVQWLMLKSELESMKSDYSNLISKGKKKISEANLDSAESDIKKASKIYPTSDEIKPLLDSINELRVKYADCYSKLEEAEIRSQLGYQPGEQGYEDIKKIYESVISDCPNIKGAKIRLNEMK